MRILLAQNMFHLPSHGGANKSNRLMVERLAARGHESHVVAPLTGRLPHLDADELPGYLAARGGTVLHSTERVLVYRYAGVTVHGVRRGRDLPQTVGAVGRELEPDWMLVPSDDPGQLVLSSALRVSERILYLVHTIQQLPFGPRSFYPSRAATAMVGRVGALVSVSRAAQDYVHRWSGLESTVVYPDVYSAADVRVPDPAAQRFVTLVNPCAYKGIDVFLALADALPDVPFLAVASWGTTDLDRAALAARPNVEVRAATDDMDEVYGRTRVLLMPSLWDETFGYSSVEAMLRGIPVLAADVAGLREAKLGVEHLLPVNPIEQYPRAADARPEPQVPEQDARPWLATLRRVLADGDEYARLSARSRAAAQQFTADLDPDALEHVLAAGEPAGRSRVTLR